MHLLRIHNNPVPNESGISLLETLVALAVLGTIAVTFLSGLIISAEAAFTTDEQATAESLARSQIEWIQDATYTVNTSQYSLATIPDITDYNNFSVNYTAESLNNPDDGIQKITVDVYRDNKTIITLESYKVNR